jgi:DNA repair exonuclease SbcCD ATPase subunit
MERVGIVAVLSACIVSLTGAVHVESHVAVIEPKLSPTLRPESDKHFFKKDYPHDLRPDPTTHHDFESPFPTIQDSDEFDKDYVKDENSDDGEWKIQNEYDRLRGKLAQARADKEKALALEKQKEKELEAARKKEAKAKAAAEAAYKVKKDREDAADKKLDKKERALSGLPGPPQGRGVDSATKNVDNEVRDLEDCQKELREARQKLKELQEVRAKAEAHEAEVEKLSDAAEEKQVAKMKYEQGLEEQVAKEQADYDKAHSTYLKEKKSLAQMEADLKKAEAKLRRFRHSEVDANGGVYRLPEKQIPLPSGAAKTSTSFAVLSVIAAATIGALV